MLRPQVKEATQVQGLFLSFGFAIAAFFPFLALYLEKHHGLDAAQIGVVIACSAAARMIAQPGVGPLRGYAARAPHRAPGAA